jgi:hypothetical protein
MAEKTEFSEKEPLDRWDILPAVVLFCSIVLFLLFSTAGAGSAFVKSHGGSSRDTACRANMKQIATAKEEYAAKYHLPLGVALPEGCLWAKDGFIKSQSECPSGGEYTVGAVGELPKCSVGGKHSLE